MLIFTDAAVVSIMKDHVEIISVFSNLGRAFKDAALPGNGTEIATQETPSSLCDEIEKGRHNNPWFIPEFIRMSYDAWARALIPEKIEAWLSRYPSISFRRSKPRTIAVIMAGNIPMVGLHDLLCVLASGHNVIIKQSSQDNRLIPIVIDILIQIDPALEKRIAIQENVIKGFDAVIANGSNNTSRYFEYYFGKYPSIIRKNRNSAAIITGNESHEEYQALAKDIFSYFGLGCRNISKVYVPENYDPAEMLPHFGEFAFIADHNKYRNNYDYQKSIFIINNIPHYDNSFLLLREEQSLISPIAVLNYERYHEKSYVIDDLIARGEMIQCIISTDPDLPMAIPPGSAQFPELWDYADGIDSMEFLSGL